MGTVHAFPGQQFRGSQPRAAQVRGTQFRGSPVGGSSRGGPAPRVAPVERRPSAVRGPSAHGLPATPRSAPARPPLRLTRRGRFVVRAMAVLAAVGMLLVILLLMPR